MSKDKSEASAVQVLESTFPVLSQGAEEILAVIDSNLQGETISPFDLEQIKVPGGGSLSWQLSTGEEEKVLEGIIVYHKLPRGRWEGTIEETGGGQPPVCVSEDSIVGVGDPGGDCLTCPFAQFGTSDKGAGQACKQRRLLFLLREGNLLPAVISIPAMSLKASKQYMVSLVSRGIALHSVMTKVTLEKAQNQAGITYARAKFAMGERLTAEHAAQVERYAQSMRGLFAAVRIEHTDAAEPEAAAA